MPSSLIFSLTLFILSLSHGYSDTLHHLCDIERLTATEPHLSMKDEAGVTEIWDYQTPEFLCAGIVAVRLVVYPAGLLLPSYNTAPFLSFVIQGRGVHGVDMSGSKSESPGDEKNMSWSREGDVISSSTGSVQWIYNDGDTDLITITLIHSKNSQNQLDPEKVRSFFIAGKSQQSREYTTTNGGNIFSGINEELLQEIFPEVDHDSIRKIRAEHDERGSIVLAPGLQFQIQEESQQSRHNLNNSTQSEFMDPRLGLSAARFVLCENAILGPEWMNAHRAVYVTNGGGRFTVVNDEGNAIFDGLMQRGKILVIPQGFVVAVKAGRGGLEWMEMRTKDEVVRRSVVGKKSVLEAIPVEVLAKAFDVSTEMAKRLKKGREMDVVCRRVEEFGEREGYE